MHTNVVSLNGGLWRPEAQTNVLVPSSSTLSDRLALGLYFGVGEDVRLLHKGTLRLDGQLGRHGCGIPTPACAGKWAMVGKVGKVVVVSRRSSSKGARVSNLPSGFDFRCFFSPISNVGEKVGLHSQYGIAYLGLGLLLCLLH